MRSWPPLPHQLLQPPEAVWIQSHAKPPPVCPPPCAVVWTADHTAAGPPGRRAPLFPPLTVSCRGGYRRQQGLWGTHMYLLGRSEHQRGRADGGASLTRRRICHQQGDLRLPSPAAGSPVGCSKNFLETVANVKGLQSGLFFDHMLPQWGRNRVEGLQTEPRVPPASGALPGFQPHLLLEAEGHGVWGPGSRRPFPAPVPSGPNEVGISPQLLRPGAWVLPETRPGPWARPSAQHGLAQHPEWASVADIGAAPEPQLPGLPMTVWRETGSPPPPKPHSQQRTVTRATSVSSSGSVVGTSNSQHRGPARQHGEPGTSCLQKQFRQIQPPPWVPITDESKVITLQEKR